MKVGVIMGGISSEREISLKSGNSIVEKIDKIWRRWNCSICTSNFRYTIFRMWTN